MAFPVNSNTQSTMEGRNLLEYFDEEKRNVDSPSRFSFTNDGDDYSHFDSARRSCVSTMSQWAQSPMHSISCPPLSYHCLASLHRTSGNIFSIAVTKDLILTGSESNRIHAWKQPDCSEMGFIKARAGEVRAVVASGNLIFTSHGDFKIRVWEVSSSKENLRPKKIITLPKRQSFFSYPKKNTQQHRGRITCLAYNSKEKLIYTGSSDQTVKVWKISEQQCVDSFVAHDGPVNGVLIKQEDGFLFTCSSDGAIKIWRRISRESSHILTMTLKFQDSPLNALALSVSPGNCFLYSGSSDGLINFWEKERCSARYNHGGFLQGHHFAVLCLVTTEDFILSGSEDTTIRIWQRENDSSYHSCVAVIDGHHGPVKCLAAALDTSAAVKGLLVYSASLDQTLKVWRVKICPAEKVGFDSKARCERSASTGWNMSPVLSPSWVAKKIHVSNF